LHGTGFSAQQIHTNPWCYQIEAMDGSSMPK
jgi:hypothetical protein